MNKHEAHMTSNAKDASDAPVNGDQKSEAPVQEDHEQDADEVRDDISEHMIEKNDAADIALAAVDELADRATELDALKEQLDAAQDQLLRNAAEFQNYRRRAEQEKSQLVELGKSVVLRQFLDVLDDLQRSLDAADLVGQREGDPRGAFDALKQGVELVNKKFMDELSRYDVRPIEAVGNPFDESEHEAVMQQADTDAAPGTVIEELQKGYRMGDRVLRHAKVIVAA